MHMCIVSMLCPVIACSAHVHNDIKVCRPSSGEHAALCPMPALTLVTLQWLPAVLI